MYANFTQALMNAKRASQLRGIPFGNRDVLNLRSGYMEGAAERVTAERSSKLAEDTLEANKENWANTLTQEKELAGLSRQTALDTTNRQVDAADRAAQKTLYGNAISTGLGIGGTAYLMYPSAPTAAQAALSGGPASGILADMGTPVSEAGHQAVAGGTKSSLGGYAAPLAYIAAAEMVRKSQGQLDREYEDRGAFAKMASAPVTGGPPALLEAAGVGSGNAFVKPMTAVAKAEEQLVGQPLDEFFEGDIEGGLGATVGGIVEAPKTFINTVTGGDCIIVTACTDRHSPEVEIARAFRDKFLGPLALRGYYCLGERIVPTLEANEKTRLFVKKWLVERLVDFGGVALGRKEKTSLRSSGLVSRLFLMLCRTIGTILPRYVRQNGEVY